MIFKLNQYKSVQDTQYSIEAKEKTKIRPDLFEKRSLPDEQKSCKTSDPSSSVGQVSVRDCHHKTLWIFNMEKE